MALRVVAVYSIREIARALDLTLESVRERLAGIYKQLGVSSRLQLALCTAHCLMDGRAQGRGNKALMVRA
jgi:DNA-binding CsgD family transcriptional regulator